VAKVLPFSPRLVLLKLEPGDLEMDLGAPIFNSRGELVGMLHSFAGEGEKSGGFRFFLARERAHLPGEKDLPGDEAPEWPENLADDPTFRACRAFWEGVAATLRQDWPGAREKFNAALRHPGTWPEACYGRGVARYHLGEYEAAGQDFLKAIRALPGYGLAFLWLGRAWEGQGKPEEALSAYQQAAAADPGLGEAWFRWGTALYRQGDLSQAREYLEKAGDDFPQAAQRWWYLGNIAQAEHQPEKALKAFHRARELDPNFFAPYIEEGKLLIDLGRPREAAPILAKVVQSHPQWPLSRFHLARAYFMSANTAGAWEEYFALQKIHPALAIRLVSVLEQSY
jgi:tetratricopeptide (TPR) repeat protein